MDCSPQVFAFSLLILPLGRMLINHEAVTFQPSIPRPSIIEMPGVSVSNAIVEEMKLGENFMFGGQTNGHEPV